MSLKRREEKGEGRRWKTMRTEAKTNERGDGWEET